MIERDDPQDKDLAALYREASVEQPSTGLDARILAAARATAAAPRVAAPSWVNRWKIPVALAAMVVMTTTITLLVQDEEAGRLEKPEAGVARQRTTPPAAAEPAGPSVPAATPATPVPAPKPVEARRKEMAPPPARDNAAPPPRAEPPANPAEAPAGAKAEAAAPELSRSLGAVSAEKKATQSTPATDEIRQGTSSGGAVKDQPMLEKAQPQMQAAPPPAPKPAPVPRAIPSAPAFVPAPAPAPMAAPARRADSAERDAARTPEQWIAEIRRMRQEGRAAEAEASLAEFRKRYPYYALPEDLKRP